MTTSRAAGALRPLEAYEALSRFAGRRGDAAFRLAMHASVPQSFRPELLHLLTLNFVPEAADDPAAEADVLLAPFTDDLGGGYFQFDPEVRRLLLDHLGDTYAHEPALRVCRVADFLLRYVERAERHSFAAHDRLGREFLETQRWVGLAFARPEAAAEQLAVALKAAEDRPELGARLHLGGLANAVAIPLAHHRDLLDYALGLQALESGEDQAARELLEPLLEREITVGRVTLQPGRAVAPAAMEAEVEQEETPSSGDEHAYRVFISGTQLDLQEYRDAAAEVCQRLFMIPVRWETLPPASVSPHSPSFWDTERVDLLLCLVGRRYGDVPRGREWSGTETELNHARSHDIEVLPLFVDPPDAGPDSASDAFRQRILREHGVVQVVHSLEEFRAAVQQTLEIWIQRQSALPTPSAPAEDVKRRNPQGGALRKLFLLHDQTESGFGSRLYLDLEEAGFEVGMDSMDFASSTGVRAARSALEASDALVLVVTRDTREQRWMRDEWRRALEMGKLVIPVLRTENPERDVPAEIKQFQSFDFHGERPYAAAFQELLRVLRHPPVPRPGAWFAVPPLPSTLVHRAVLADLKSVVLTGPLSVTVLEGPGGVGKSTLAVALAHDEEVRRRFPDGVVWLAAGEEDDIAYQQAVFLDTRRHPVYEPDEALSGSEGLERAMRRVLTPGAFLVIVDDARVTDDIEHLTRIGPRSRLLVTSRNLELGRRPDAQRLPVPLLTTSEALQLLAGESGVAVGDLPPEAHEVAELTGFSPLALRQAAEQVRTGTTWRELVERLRSPDDVQDSGESESARLRLEALSLLERRLLAGLTLFDAGEEIEDPEVVAVARAMATATPREAKRALARLAELSLVERGRSPHVIRLHPLVHRLASRDLSAVDEREALGSLAEIFLQEGRLELADRFFERLRRVAQLQDDADPGLPPVLERMTFPEPVMDQTIEPRTPADEARMGEALRHLAKEDPTFRVRTDPETEQTIISGMGELHLEILVDRMLREFKVNANVGRPRVSYRETIRKTVEKIEGKYVRQARGSGQYGHVVINLMPAEPGQGFVFEDRIGGGVIPREFIEPARQGMRDAMETGVLAGYPMVDVRVELVFGTYHETDSSEAAFRIAGSMAFKEATRRAGPVLLEPVMDVEVVTPTEYLGDVLEDLNRRRGAIHDRGWRGEARVISAVVPLSEMFGYSTTLRSMSQGRALYSMQFARYEEVPRSKAEEIIAMGRG